MRDIKRLTASVLTAALILSALPFTVFADEVPETEPDVTSETEYVDADNEGLEAEIDEAADETAAAEVADAAEEETVLENAEEITAEEIVAEETAAEEVTSEEAPAEEAPAEEITAEEVPAEEIQNLLHLHLRLRRLLTLTRHLPLQAWRDL